MKITFLFIVLLIAAKSFSQKTYLDSLQEFQKEYIQKHEVVKGSDRKRLSFFPLDSTYRVRANFEKKENSPWFQMATSGPIKKLYRVYGLVHFTLNDHPVQLSIYQSQDLLQNPEYRTYLFLPFTDLTSGKESYDGGRYIDLRTEDISGKEVLLDFNKAYNPYCAYVSGKYNCPIPPSENHLSIGVRAGEKAFKDDLH